MKIERKEKFNTFTVTLTALLIATAITLPVLIANQGNFYLVGDYMSQQIPFINECRRMLKSGLPFWSSNTFLGANFLGTYSFYNYASPFYLPIFLMPESMTGLGVGIMFIVKHAIAALTSFIFFKKYVKARHLAFIGALIYAFSGFAMDSSYFYHFHDVIAVFPLIPYLIDEVLDNRKKVFLSLAVLLNAVTNYYFFVATSVFILIYLFFKVRYSVYTFKDFGRCMIFYAFGGLAAMFMLLPSALSLLETYKATSSFSNILTSGLSTVPQLIKIIKGLVLPSEGILGSATGFTFSNFNSNAAFLPFFGAVYMFIALRRKNQEWYSKLFRFLFILAVIPFGNGIFSLFTNMRYTRWWYCFVLIEILISIRIIEEKTTEKALYKSSAKTIAILSAVTVGLPLIAKVLCAYIIDKDILKNLPDAAINYLDNCGLLNRFDIDDLRYAVVFIILTALTYIPAYIFIKKNWIIKASKAVPAVILICALSYGIYLCNEAEIWNTQKNAEYRGNDISASESVEYDSRTHYDYSFANYPAVINRPGITAFHSFKSHSTAEFCKIVGYADTLHATATRYFDTPAIQSVLNIKSIVDSKGNEEAAPYYSPFGYVYEYYVLTDKYAYTTEKSENNKRIELMTAACFIDEETANNLSAVIKPFNEENFNWKKAVKQNRTTAATNFKLDSKGFTATSYGTEERLIYFSIPHDNGWKAFINGEETAIYTLNGGLTGIVVPEGKANITFEFTTPGLKSGAAISLISLLMLCAYSILNKVKNKR